MQPTPLYSSMADEIGSRTDLGTHLLWIIPLLTFLLPLYDFFGEIVGRLENSVPECAWNVLATHFTSFLGYAYFVIQKFFYQFVDATFGSSWMEHQTLHCTVRVCFDPISYKIYVLFSEATIFIGHILFEFGHRTIQTFVTTSLCLIPITVLYQKFFKTMIAETRAAEQAKLQKQEFAKRWPRNKRLSILNVTLLSAGDPFAAYLEKLWRSQSRSFTSDDIPLAAYKTYYWVASDAANAATTQTLRSLKPMKKSLPSSPGKFQGTFKEAIDAPLEKLGKSAFTSLKPAIRHTIPWNSAVSRILSKPAPARSPLKAQTVFKTLSPPVILSAVEEPARPTTPERVESVEAVAEAADSTTLPTNEEPEKKAVMEESLVVNRPTPAPAPQEQPIESTAQKSDVPTTALTDVAEVEEPMEGSAQPADNSPPITIASQELVKLGEVAVKAVPVSGDGQNAEKRDAGDGSSSDAPVPETKASATHLEYGAPLTCDLGAMERKTRPVCKAGLLSDAEEREKKTAQAAANSLPIATAEPTKNLPGWNDSAPYRSSRCNQRECCSSSESEGARGSGGNRNFSSDGEMSLQRFQKRLLEIINPSPPRPRPIIQGHRATVLTYLNSPVAIIKSPVRNPGKRGGSSKSLKKTTKKLHQWESPIPLLKPGVVSLVAEQFPESPSSSRSKLPLPHSLAEVIPPTPAEVLVAEEQPKLAVIVSECDPVWGDISILDQASEQKGFEAVANQQDGAPDRGMLLITFNAVGRENLTAVSTLPSQDHGPAEQIAGSIMDELLATDASLPDVLIPIDAIEKASGEGEEPATKLVGRSYSGDKGQGRAIEDEAPTFYDVMPQVDAPLLAQEFAPPQDLSRDVLGLVAQAEVNETSRAAELDQPLQFVDHREGGSEARVGPSTETPSNVAIHEASKPNVDLTADIQPLEAPSSVMDIQELQGNADEEARENSMDLSTEHDCPTSVTVAHHGAVMGNGSGEEADAPPYQHQGQELQSADADESIAAAIEEDEAPQLVAEEANAGFVLAAADAAGDESEMEQIPISGQETEAREMDVTATEHHGHLHWIEEEVATVMGQQTVRMPSAVEFAGAPGQAALPAPASCPLRPVKALPSRRPKPITAEETVTTAPPKIQSQGLYQIASGMHPSEPCATEGAALDAAIAMVKLGGFSDDDIGAIIQDRSSSIPEPENPVSDETSWSQRSEALAAPPGGYSQPSWDSSQNYPDQIIYTVDKYTGMGYVGPDFSSYNAGHAQGGYSSSAVYSQQYSSTGVSADDLWLQAQPITDTPFSSPLQTGNQGSPLFSSVASSFDIPSPSGFRFLAPIASSSQSAIPPPSTNQGWLDWLDPSLQDGHLEHAHPNNLSYYTGYSREALVAATNERYSLDNVGRQVLPTSIPESSTRYEPAPTRSEYMPNPHTLRPDPAVVRRDPLPPPPSYQPDPAVHPPPSLYSQCTPSFSPTSPTPSDAYRSPSSSSSHTSDPKPSQGPSYGLYYTDSNQPEREQWTVRTVRYTSDEEQVDYGSD